MWSTNLRSQLHRRARSLGCPIDLWALPEDRCCNEARHVCSWLNNKLDRDTIVQIVTEAVDIEREFVTESLPVNLIGMNSGFMAEYIEFVADRLLVSLGQDKLYGTSNPFPWMEQISLQCVSFCSFCVLCFLFSEFETDKTDELPVIHWQPSACAGCWHCNLYVCLSLYLKAILIVIGAAFFSYTCFEIALGIEGSVPQWSASHSCGWTTQT